MDTDSYLERIGVDPSTVGDADRETLARLQRAHVCHVPFENLDIVGPRGENGGPGVELSVPALYEKIVERERGGYCFELNGLFHCLLDALGYDVDRVAARVVGDDGDASPPANHHTNIVHLDRRYVADVGMGPPVLREPLPLEGTERTDETGVTWRITESDRPDETYRSEYREPGETAWSVRFVFGEEPRDLRYFAATNDYLQTAPESPFTDHPIVSVATLEGYLKLSEETLTETVGARQSERTVGHNEWRETLTERFGLHYGQDTGAPGTE